jgi:hypothetical protein
MVAVSAFEKKRKKERSFVQIQEPPFSKEKSNGVEQ